MTGAACGGSGRRESCHCVGSGGTGRSILVCTPLPDAGGAFCLTCIFSGSAVNGADDALGLSNPSSSLAGEGLATSTTCAVLADSLVESARSTSSTLGVAERDSVEGRRTQRTQSGVPALLVLRKVHDFVSERVRAPTLRPTEKHGTESPSIARHRREEAVQI